MSTIIRDEILKFAKMSNGWYSSEYQILRKITPLRLELINETRKKYNLPENSKILDVGCGGGLVTIPLARMGFEVTGIDPCAENILAAKTSCEEGLKIKLLNTEIESFEEKNFDMIVCLEVIEHIQNHEIFFKSIASKLKPGGIVIFSTINRNALSYLLGIVAAEYILKWVPKGTHDFIKFIKPSELASFGRKAKLEMIELKGINFDLCNQKWMISQNIYVNYFSVFRNIDLAF